MGKFPCICVCTFPHIHVHLPWSIFIYATLAPIHLGSLTFAHVCVRASVDLSVRTIGMRIRQSTRSQWNSEHIHTNWFDRAHFPGSSGDSQCMYNTRCLGTWVSKQQQKQTLSREEVTNPYQYGVRHNHSCAIHMISACHLHNMTLCWPSQPGVGGECLIFSFS